MNAAAKRRTIVFDPDANSDGDCMEFRLTYEGPLRASNMGERDARSARKDHKHQIRTVFHHQLKRLWEITPFLDTGERSGASVRLLEESPDHPDYKRETLARKFAMYGFNFVPLVTKELSLMCSLDILFLRPAAPGNLLSQGDIDNRLKTLFDCLQIPDANQSYADRTPAAGEAPFYCLLENDRLITKVSVETDTLLEEIAGSHPDRENDARLVITVRIRPQDMTIGNMQFG